MIQLFNGVSGEMIGKINEDQFDLLMDYLTDQSGEERFVITGDTLTFLKKKRGVLKETVTLLQGALGKSRQLILEYHIPDETDVAFGPEEEEEEEEEL